jgi:hypothetical protein
MSKLLELVEQLMASSITANIYTDTNQYREAVGGPLKFSNSNDHPHGNLQGVNIPSSPNLHNTLGDFREVKDPSIGSIAENKRGEFYKDRPIPPSLKKQLEIMGADRGNPPPPSRGVDDNTVHNMVRGEIYNTTPEKIPLDIEQQKNNFQQPINIPRDEIYKSSQVFGEISQNKTTQNDVIANEGGVPPRPDFKGVDDNPGRRTYVPLEGQIRRSFSEGHRLGNLYDDSAAVIGADRGGTFMQFTSPAPSETRFFDVFAISNWLRGIGKEIALFPFNNNDPLTREGRVERTGESISKGLTWAASQLLLTSLNLDTPYHAGLLGTIDNQLWNPLSLAASAIPLVRPDLGVGVTSRALQGEFVGLSDGVLKEKQPVDFITLQTLKHIRFHDEPEEVTLENKTVLAQLFDTAQGFQPFKGDSSDRSLFPTRSSLKGTNTPKILNARFYGQSIDEKQGTFEAPLNEDETYFPFMFQDLRDNPPKFLYFRAFLKEGLTENFTPEWQQERYYGRVDPVPIYMGTIRTVNLGFDVVAWTPADLPVMWKKLHKLQSMVYPAFDQTGFLKAGPIIRMRIGDLISTGEGKGLPGYITSLNFAFDDGIWNLQEKWKIPRKVSVTLSYTALHENSPGLSNPSTIPEIDATKFGGVVYDDSDQAFISKETDVRGIMKTVDEEYYDWFELLPF